MLSPVRLRPSLEKGGGEGGQNLVLLDSLEISSPSTEKDRKGKRGKDVRSKSLF